MSLDVRSVHQVKQNSAGSSPLDLTANRWIETNQKHFPTPYTSLLHHSHSSSSNRVGVGGSRS